MSFSGITINGRRYESPDAMPPDVRRLYDEGLRAIERGLQQAQGGTAMSTRLHLGLDSGHPEVMSSSGPAPSPRPIEPWSVPLDLGRFVTGVAFFVIVGLALLLFLGR